MIVHLIRSLDKIKEPSARALIIWIVGEYSDIGHIIPKIIPVVASYLGQCFSSEELEGKHQILNTVAKVVLNQGWNISLQCLTYKLLFCTVSCHSDSSKPAFLRNALLFFNSLEVLFVLFHWYFNSIRGNELYDPCFSYSEWLVLRGHRRVLHWNRSCRSMFVFKTIWCV